MLKRTLPLAIVLLAPFAPLTAQARPCCDERGAHATLELSDAHGSLPTRAVSAAKAKTRATALAPAHPIARVAPKHATASATPVSAIAPARAIAMPATPARPKNPVRSDSAPRIGPMVLSHQSFQI